MTEKELIEAAGDNMAESFMQLALAVPGAERVASEGYEGYRGPSNHPMCNFAIRLRLNPGSAYRLQQMAHERPQFQVYRLPDDTPAYADELLTNAEFYPSHELDQMVCQGSATSSLQLTAAIMMADRMAAGDFMARQFFGRHGRKFRDEVRDATAMATGLQIFTLTERSRIVAALILSRTSGMLGIYSLCVSPARRRRGVGSEVVRWVQAVANAEGRVATVQCEPGLSDWYSRLGYRRLAKIKVFASARPAALDIIGIRSIQQRVKTSGI